MIFITQYPPYFYCSLCDLLAFVWCPPPPRLHFTPPPCDLCSSFLLHLTPWVDKHGIYGSVSTFYKELWRKQCEKALQANTMSIYDRVWELAWWRVTAHLTGSPTFLQMGSIEKVTRGRMLLRGSYYFSITIETQRQAFSWSRPGVHWHQLLQVLTKPSALWIIPICTQFTYEMSCQQNAMTACLHTWQNRGVLYWPLL